MKHNKLLILSLIMLTILSFGCKKENNVQPKTEVSAKDKAITQKIVNFKTKLLSYKDTPNAKDGVVMPIDSAVWYSEALLNYSYCNAAAGFNNFTTVSDTISVPSTNGQVRYSDLYNTYTLMETLLTEQQNSLQNPDANLVLADITGIGDNNGKISFVVTSGFSDEEIEVDPLIDIDFRTAAKVISQRVNQNIPIPTTGFYYTDITTINIFGPFQELHVFNNNGQTNYNYDLLNHDDPHPGDNMYDYNIFYCFYAEWMPNFHWNLCPAEINFYANRVGKINQDMFSMITEINGKHFIGMSAVGQAAPSLPEWDRMHEYNLKYANIVLTVGGGNNN